MSSYETGTGVVAGILGACALALAAFADRLADGINRDTAPAVLIVVLALISLTIAGMSLVVPGIWRLVCLTVATLPLLWIVAAVGSTA
jgi:fatty acid desaturase